MTLSASIGSQGEFVREPVGRTITGVERAVIGFASLQFFSLIYLQKFALFSPGFPVSVPMLIMFASVGWMVASRNLEVVASRSSIFLIFFGLCLFSESLNQGSVSSFIELILLYACITVCANLSIAAYDRIVNRFIMLMILPAIIIIVQYTYQRSTGLSDPINLERLFPKSILMPGFFYNAHYPWYSTFSRPNGFFFLEPSFASAFTATATILELTHFRRRWCVGLMAIATGFSMGATGILMLIIATPILLSRVRLEVAVVTTIVALTAIGVAYLLGFPIPVISRAEELADPKSSGSDRMLNPAIELVTTLLDPSASLIGKGAGSSPPGQVWPLLKLLWEFGPFAMVSFLALYITGIARSPNLALTVSLSIMYHFTGGYLLSPPMVELVILFCFLLLPRRAVTEPDTVASNPRGWSATG